MLKALQILALPLLEFVALRLYVRDYLGIRVGYVGLTDYDWLFPGACAFIILVHTLERQEKLPGRIHPWRLILNLTLFGSFALFNLFYPEWTMNAGGKTLVWLFFALLVLVSAFFTYVTPFAYLNHPGRGLLLPACFAGASKIISVHVLSFLWVPLAVLSGRVAFLILSPFLDGLKFSIRSAANTYAYISHPFFNVAIGAGCGGMEGISLLSFLLLLFYVANKKKLDAKGWFFVWILSVLWMFCLNILRICLFYLISLWAIRKMGNTQGIQVFRALFHNVSGWVLYTVGIYFFYRLFLLKPKRWIWNRPESAISWEAT